MLNGVLHKSTRINNLQIVPDQIWEVFSGTVLLVHVFLPDSINPALRVKLRVWQVLALRVKQILALRVKQDLSLRVEQVLALRVKQVLLVVKQILQLRVKQVLLRVKQGQIY